MKKFLIYSTLIFTIGMVLFFKNFIIYALESSLTTLLETPVKVKELRLSSLELYASIKENSNNAYIKINSFYPLKADVAYVGNVDAFKVYQPLKADAKLKGSVYYKDALVVKAELLALGAKSVVEVKELSEDWEVLAHIKDLNLSQLQYENNISTEMSGVLDADVNYHTSKDSVITVTSKKLNFMDKKLEDVKVQLSKVKQNIYTWAIFKSDELDYKGIWFNYDEDTKSFDGSAEFAYLKIEHDIKIKVMGDFNSTQLKADIKIESADSTIDVNDIVYDLNSSNVKASVDINFKKLQNHKFFISQLGQKLSGDFKAKGEFFYVDKKISASLSSQSLGGQLKLWYKQKDLKWDAENIELEKVMKLLVLDQKLKAKMTSKGELKHNRLKASLKSEKLEVEKTVIKDINLSAYGDLKDLKMKLSFDSKYLRLKSSNISLVSLNRLDIEAKLRTVYLKKEIHLNAKASINEKSLELRAESKEFQLKEFKGYLNGDKFKAQYKLKVFPLLSTLKNPLDIEGDIGLDKEFFLIAKTEDLGGFTKVVLRGDMLTLNASKLDVKSLLINAKQKNYANGKFDIRAKGSLKKLDFTLESKDLSLNKKFSYVDENLSFKLKGQVDTKEVKIHPYLNNRHLKINKGEVKYQFKKKYLDVRLPLVLTNKDEDAELLVLFNADLKDDLKANLNIKHKWDDFTFTNIVLKNKKLSTNIDLNIDDLSEYQKVSGQELYGPIRFKGQLQKDKKVHLVLNSTSLGGHTKISLEDKDLNISLKNIEAVKVGKLLKQKGSSETGRINGELIYNLDNKSGFTRLKAEDIEIKGIDIDASLKELQDILGLNIFAMGNSLLQKGFSQDDNSKLKTYIQALEFDVDITPESIISKDIALSTEHTRFAVEMDLKHNGEIKEFEMAILNYKGCAIIKQKLRGNITDPKLVNSTGSAVRVLGKAPNEILKTGGKIISTGAGLVDSTASFIWEKGLRQDSNVTLINDTLTKGGNIFSSSKDLIVGSQCTVFYSGKVKPPQ